MVSGSPVKESAGSQHESVLDTSTAQIVFRSSHLMKSAYEPTEFDSPPIVLPRSPRSIDWISWAGVWLPSGMILLNAIVNRNLVGIGVRSRDELPVPFLLIITNSF